jgi:hypothetical protein
VENASDARLLYMYWACLVAVVCDSEPVMGVVQVICMKLACYSGTKGCCDMPARGKHVAMCWLGIGGVVATLCGLLCECRRVCIGADLW